MVGIWLFQNFVDLMMSQIVRVLHVFWAHPNTIKATFYTYIFLLIFPVIQLASVPRRLWIPCHLNLEDVKRRQRWCELIILKAKCEIVFIAEWRVVMTKKRYEIARSMPQEFVGNFGNVTGDNLQAVFGVS